MSVFQRRSEIIRMLSVILLILGIGVYAFTQAMQVPLSQESAGKVLGAWQLLHGEITLGDWHYALPELPLILICVSVCRLSTLSAIVDMAIWAVIIFCIGLFILHSRKKLNLCNVLIWTALTGLPDPVWLESVYFMPAAIGSLLLFLHYLSLFIESRKRKHAAGAVITGILLLFSVRIPNPYGSGVSAVHETIRAMQAVFRADFSMQPLFRLTTARFFLMTLIMLIFLIVVLKTVFRLIRRQESGAAQAVFSIAAALTIIICCLPAGDRKEKIVICAWLPYAASILLIFALEKLNRDNLRIAGGALSVSAVSVLFALAVILFGFSPIVRSRPPGTADQIVLLLEQHGLDRGYCDPKDQALFTVAGKGKISFTADIEDQSNGFLLLRSEEQSKSNTDESYTVGDYCVVIFERPKTETNLTGIG